MATDEADGAPTAPAHLQEQYRRKVDETVELTRRSIALLRQRNEKVSYATLREASFEVSKGLRRLSASTIVRNQSAHNLYEAAASNKTRVRRMRVPRSVSDLPVEEQKAERLLLYRLARKSKTELVGELRATQKVVSRLKKELSRLRADRLDASLPASIRPLRS